MGTIFDENCTSPLGMPGLPFQGALKLRGKVISNLNTETLTEVTSPPIGKDDECPSDLIKSPPTRKQGI